jgi:hypothetical protein
MYSLTLKYLNILFILAFLSFSCKEEVPVLVPIPEIIPPKEIILYDTSMISVAKGFEALMIQKYIIPDKINDGLVKYGDVKGIDTLIIQALDFGNYEFTSLKGIEYFPDLLYLNIHGSYVDSVDLSKNTKLRYLDCSGATVGGAGVNATVKYLNVSACKDLQYLYCYDNLITSLDVSKNTKLKVLDFESNLLSSIDISKNLQLEYFRSSFNKKIVSLDLSKSTMLKFLFCAANTLEVIDVSMLPELIELDCSLNLDDHLKTFETLDISKNRKLKYLNISGARFSNIDMSHNSLIDELDVSLTNNLKSIDLSNLKDLAYLDVSRSALTQIDLGLNQKLEYFSMSATNLNKVDLSKNVKLKKFICFQHQFITELDLRACMDLEMCYTFICPNLKTICVSKIPNVNDFNWKTDDFSNYRICK